MMVEVERLLDVKLESQRLAPAAHQRHRRLGARPPRPEGRRRRPCSRSTCGACARPSSPTGARRWPTSRKTSCVLVREEGAGLDAQQRRDAEATIERLIARFGYCKECAGDSASLLAAQALQRSHRVDRRLELPRGLSREVRRLAVPAIAQSLLQTLVFVVDRIMLGPPRRGVARGHADRRAPRVVRLERLLGVHRRAPSRASGGTSARATGCARAARRAPRSRYALGFGLLVTVVTPPVVMGLGAAFPARVAGRRRRRARLPRVDARRLAPAVHGGRRDRHAPGQRGHAHAAGHRHRHQRRPRRHQPAYSSSARRGPPRSA